jgi:cell division transport system permease protein
MKIPRNRTGYFIKEGITSIFTHSLMSFASVCIIVAFLIIMGSFVLIALNINALIGELESENVILVYVDENLSNTEAISLGMTLRSIPNVTGATFISREQAMQSFIGKYENTERFKDVEASWFRHRYTVYVEDVALIAETQQNLREIYGVARVNANLKIAQGLVTMRNVVSIASVVIVAVLLAISLFIMSNTIKLATFERREEIAIMKMVGATNSFIRWPFIYEGFILGMIGAMAAFGSLFGLYGLVADRVIDFELGFVSLMPFSTVSRPMLIAFAAIGFGVGVGGSGMTLNKYLKV